MYQPSICHLSTRRVNLDHYNTQFHFKGTLSALGVEIILDDQTAKHIVKTPQLNR